MLVNLPGAIIILNGLEIKQIYLFLAWYYLPTEKIYIINYPASGAKPNQGYSRVKNAIETYIVCLFSVGSHQLAVIS